jgi:hypothetical protein
MADALAGVPVAALPGDYQPQDIGTLVAGGDPIGDQIAVVGEDGDVIRSAPAPLPATTAAPPTTVRMAPPPERKGFFKRLFGG